MAIKIHEHFVCVYRQDRELPVTAFCTSKLNDWARDKIAEHLRRPDLPEYERGLIWQFDFNRKTGALRANGVLIV